MHLTFSFSLGRSAGKVLFYAFERFEPCLHLARPAPPVPQTAVIKMYLSFHHIRSLLCVLNQENRYEQRLECLTVLVPIVSMFLTLPVFNSQTLNPSYLSEMLAPARVAQVA